MNKIIKHYKRSSEGRSLTVLRKIDDAKSVRKKNCIQPKNIYVLKKIHNIRSMKHVFVRHRLFFTSFSMF